MENIGNKGYILDTRSIHDYLTKNRMFQDGNLAHGEVFELRNNLTFAIRKTIISELTRLGYSILVDSCNLKREKRLAFIQEIKDVIVDSLNVIILHIDTPFDVVHQRAKLLDDELELKGEPRSWLELVEKQVKEYEAPDQSECNNLMVVRDLNLHEKLEGLMNVI